MDILLVEKDRLVRDQVKVGLQQFPDLQITTGEGYGGLNQLRQRPFDLLFLGLPGELVAARQMVEYFRSIDKSTDVVIVAPAKTARDLAQDKSRFNIWSSLSTPINVMDFFRLVARIRERLDLAADGSAKSRGGRSGAGV